MRYIAAILFMLIIVTGDGCKGKGIYWDLDGIHHTFIWGAVR